MFLDVVVKLEIEFGILYAELFRNGLASRTFISKSVIYV